MAEVWPINNTIEGVLKYPSPLVTNNPESYGIVFADDIAGHRNVPTKEFLYIIPTAILSKSKNNTNNDALGQLWYVQSEQVHYRLIDWDKRTTEEGWKKFKPGFGEDTHKILSFCKVDSALSFNNFFDDNNQKLLTSEGDYFLAIDLKNINPESLIKYQFNITKEGSEYYDVIFGKSFSIEQNIISDENVQIVIDHSNIITKSAATYDKLSYDENGHITGKSALTNTDVSNILKILPKLDYNTGIADNVGDETYFVTSSSDGDDTKLFYRRNVRWLTNYLDKRYGALDDVKKFKEFLESTDATDNTINRWKELEAFLEGITDTQTLMGIIQNTVSNVSNKTINLETTVDYSLLSKEGDSIIVGLSNPDIVKIKKVIINDTIIIGGKSFKVDNVRKDAGRTESVIAYTNDSLKTKFTNNYYLKLSFSSSDDSIIFERFDLLATPNVAGIMSAMDKHKLNNLIENSFELNHIGYDENYVLLNGLSWEEGDIDNGELGMYIAGYYKLSAATKSTAGVMSAADKIRLDNAIQDYQYNCPGIINASNGLLTIANKDWHSTEFIVIDNNEQIKVTGVFGQTVGAIIFYDKDKKFISSIQGNDNTVISTIIVEPEDIPENAVYFRSCATVYQPAYAINGNTQISADAYLRTLMQNTKGNAALGDVLNIKTYFKLDSTNEVQKNNTYRARQSFNSDLELKNTGEKLGTTESPWRLIFSDYLNKTFNGSDILEYYKTSGDGSGNGDAILQFTHGSGSHHNGKHYFLADGFKINNGSSNKLLLSNGDVQELIHKPQSDLTSISFNHSVLNVIPTLGYLKNWNGSYDNVDGKKISSLQYCNQGKFGDIVTKNIDEIVRAEYDINSLIVETDIVPIAKYIVDNNGKLPIVNYINKTDADKKYTTSLCYNPDEKSVNVLVNTGSKLIDIYYNSTSKECKITEKEFVDKSVYDVKIKELEDKIADLVRIVTPVNL